MALITSGPVLVFVFGVMTATLSRLFADELKAWNPSLVRWLVKIAASRLPGNLQQRYEEEWQSYVNEVPGEIGKLLSAVGFLFASGRMTVTLERKGVGGNGLREVLELLAAAPFAIAILVTTPLWPVALVLLERRDFRRKYGRLVALNIRPPIGTRGYLEPLGRLDLVLLLKNVAGHAMAEPIIRQQSKDLIGRIMLEPFRLQDEDNAGQCSVKDSAVDFLLANINLWVS